MYHCHTFETAQRITVEHSVGFNFIGIPLAINLENYVRTDIT